MEQKKKAVESKPWADFAKFHDEETGVMLILRRRGARFSIRVGFKNPDNPEEVFTYTNLKPDFANLPKTPNYYDFIGRALSVLIPKANEATHVEVVREAERYVKRCNARVKKKETAKPKAPPKRPTPHVP